MSRALPRSLPISQADKVSLLARQTLCGKVRKADGES